MSNVANAAEGTHDEDWPDDAWRNWCYRRATLARLLAREGKLQEIADTYQRERDKWTSDGVAEHCTQIAPVMRQTRLRPQTQGVES